MAEILTEPILGREVHDSFSRTGWAIARGFYDFLEARRLQQFVEELSHFPERSGAQMVYREPSLLDAGATVLQRVEDFCRHHAGLDGVLRVGRLRHAVAELQGENVVLFKDKINYKAPGGAGFEPHQDQQAGWNRYAPYFVTALVSIDQASEANGCLELANHARLCHMIGSEWEPLTERQIHGMQFSVVETDPGDVVFFDSFVVHRSQANLTAYGRRVLYLTYNRVADGDLRAQYFADKRSSFPPDIERKPGIEYKYRV